MRPVEPYSDSSLSAQALTPRPFTPGHRLLRSLNEGERLRATEKTAAALTTWTGRTVDADSLKILRATPKAQTFLFQSENVPLIAKRHGQMLHYAQEMLACMLLTDQAPVPRLLADLEQPRILITEFIAESFAVIDSASLVQVMQSLAELHTAPRLRDQSARVLFPNRRLCDLQNSIEPPAYIVDQTAYRKLLEAMTAFHGESYLPFALSDLKGEHLMKKNDKCVFIDLETLRPGVPEFVDLVSVINLLPSEQGFDFDWSELLHEYRLRRANFEESMSLELLLHCLKLAARAFGAPVRYFGDN